jgi:ATP/maltotriose-dependent transcriptional regulator MalT
MGEAINHLLIVGDVEYVAEVIESQGLSLGVGKRERIQALYGWLTALPEPPCARAPHAVPPPRDGLHVHQPTTRG